MLSKTLLIALEIANLTQAITVELLNTGVEVDDDLTMQDIGYFKSDTYQAFSRAEKMEDLWTMVTEDATTLDLYWAELSEIFSAKTNGSFCQYSDEQQAWRLKTTHTQGMVAKASWVPMNQENWPQAYTGYYATESHDNIIRFSQTINLTEISGGLLPSLAMKFLIDGTYSQNIFGMPSFHETSSWDFFDTNMKSRLDHFVPADENGNNDQYLIDTIEVKLNTASKWPFTTAIGNIGDTFEDGSTIDDPIIPFGLEFSSPFKGHSYTQTDGTQWIERLQEIGLGGTPDAPLTMIEVWAEDTPGDALVKVAEVRLTTDLLTSKFGDERLHFQHVRPSMDRPYWTRAVRLAADEVDPEQALPDIHQDDFDVSAWPTDDVAAEEMLIDQIEQYGCPFYWLFAGNSFLTEE